MLSECVPVKQVIGNFRMHLPVEWVGATPDAQIHDISLQNLSRAEEQVSCSNQ